MRAVFLCDDETERSVLLDWLWYHRRLVICLLIVMLITLFLVFLLLSGHKTFVDAWYV